MYRFLVSTAAVALLSSAALAADIPVYEPPVDIAPAMAHYDWTGIYIGIQGGWKFGEDDYDVSGTDVSFDVDGPMVGGHLGFNWQTGVWVFGLEGDGEWADVDGDFTVAANGNEVGTSIEWQASLRGRLGVAWDRLLLYGTGGAAFAGTENRIFSAALAAEETEEDTRVGWTAGAGVELGITQNLSAGVEYRYTDLGDEDYASVLFPADTFTSDLSYHAIRGRVSWRFGGVGP